MVEPGLKAKQCRAKAGEIRLVMREPVASPANLTRRKFIMSVIYYSDDRKFLNIARTLGIGQEATELMHVFSYPEGWRNEPEKIIERFVQRLCDANAEAWNLKYDEGEEKRTLDFNDHAETLNRCELIKSLESIQYNMMESENYKETKDQLFHVIYFLMSRIISDMPEYKKAETWN